MLLCLVSGCNNAKVKPYELTLDNTVSQLDMTGFSMVDDSGKPTNQPRKIDSRLSKYLFVPLNYAVPADKDTKDLEMVELSTLDGKIASSVVTTSLDNMKTVQDVMKDKFGPALATRASVRDRAAFESSAGFCELETPGVARSKHPCPHAYFEIYGDNDQAYTLIKFDSIYKGGKTQLLVVGATREGKNYADSLQ